MNLRTYLLQRDPVDKKKWLYNKIVIVAHSQGALILSLALDMLFADLSDELLSRMEMYVRP